MNILVVDDDLMMQQDCQRMLRLLNHSSTAVNSATYAVEYLTETPRRFDLLILENGLSGISGMELFTILREWNVPIPVILVSGSQPKLEVNELFDESLQFHFLAKPFTIEDLRSAIERSTA